MEYKSIEDVIETADFGPFYDGKQYVTVTFRVPSDTLCPAGIWTLTPSRAETFDWAKDE